MNNKPRSVLKEIIQSSFPKLSDITEQVASQKPNPDKWSKKEILGHLIDSAINNHRRFKSFLRQAHLVFDGYDQDDEVKMNDYQNRPFSDVIALWSGMNQQVIQVIKSFPDERLTKKYEQHNYHKIGFKRIPEEDQSTIHYLILDYIGHLEHHLSQIIPNYERQLTEY